MFKKARFSAAVGLLVLALSPLAQADDVIVKPQATAGTSDIGFASGAEVEVIAPSLKNSKLKARLLGSSDSTDERLRGSFQLSGPLLSEPVAVGAGASGRGVDTNVMVAGWRTGEASGQLTLGGLRNSFDQGAPLGTSYVQGGSGGELLYAHLYNGYRYVTSTNVRLNAKAVGGIVHNAETNKAFAIVGPGGKSEIDHLTLFSVGDDHLIGVDAQLGAEVIQSLARDVNRVMAIDGSVAFVWRIPAGVRLNAGVNGSITQITMKPASERANPAGTPIKEDVQYYLGGHVGGVF